MNSKIILLAVFVLSCFSYGNERCPVRACQPFFISNHESNRFATDAHGDIFYESPAPIDPDIIWTDKHNKTQFIIRTLKKKSPTFHRLHYQILDENEKAILTIHKLKRRRKKATEFIVTSLSATEERKSFLIKNKTQSFVFVKHKIQFQKSYHKGRLIWSLCHEEDLSLNQNLLALIYFRLDHEIANSWNDFD